MRVLEYKDQDVAAMLVDPRMLINKQKTSIFGVPAFDLDMSMRENVLAYVALVYDRNSPLAQIQDIRQRKRRAAQDVGLILDVADPEVEDMMACRIPAVNKAIVTYCRLSGGRLWSVLSASEQALDQAMSQLMEEDRPKDVEDEVAYHKKKLELIELVRQRSEAIDQMASRLAAGETARAVVEPMELEAMEVPLTPEHYSNLWKRHDGRGSQSQLWVSQEAKK